MLEMSRGKSELSREQAQSLLLNEKYLSLLYFPLRGTIQNNTVSYCTKTQMTITIVYIFKLTFLKENMTENKPKS